MSSQVPRPAYGERGRDDIDAPAAGDTRTADSTTASNRRAPTWRCDPLTSRSLPQVGGTLLLARCASRRVVWIHRMSLAYLFSRRGRGEGSYLRAVAIRAVRAYHRDRWRRSFRRRLPSVDATPIDRPIFVLGLQGGGTTLVSRCLLRHPAVVSMSGNSSYWVATDEIGFVRNRMAQLPPSLWSSSHRRDLADPVFGTEHSSVYACDALLPLYRRTATDATPEDARRLARLIREHIAVYAHDRSHARFLDKTHTYTVKVAYLDALLDGFDPFFVLVLRNPYTTCFRAIRRKPPSWQAAPPYDEQLRLVAEHWENS